jgi:UDP-glucose 4-epimerase
MGCIMKNILVVGGAGYIGSHVIRELLDFGYEPVVYDNLTTGHAWAVPEKYLIVGELSHEAALNRVFEIHHFDAVMHFASSIQVGESVESPLAYYRNNVATTLVLLDVMRKNDVDKFVFSSTAAVFGTPAQSPIREDSPLCPENPYGHSKLMVEQILADCERAWGLKSAVLRYFNAAGAHPDGNIGEAHNPESHLIPLILQVAQGKREFVTINGADYPTQDGTCIRDYIHVCDLASAHILALESLLESAGSIVCNLGNGTGYSINEVIDVCRMITGHPIPIRIGKRRLGDPSALVASSEKVRAKLGWKPMYADLESIVKTAWNWHTNNPYGF